MRDRLIEELLNVQSQLLSETDFIKKIELKDRELEIKIELGMTSLGDSYEECENCSA